MQFVNSVKRLVFDLTNVPFLKCSVSRHRLIVEVLNDQNLFTESNLGDWLLSYVQFYSGGHFSERAAAAQWSGKMNHLKDNCFIIEIFDKFSFSGILRGCLSHLNEA